MTWTARRGMVREAPGGPGPERKGAGASAASRQLQLPHPRRRTKARRGHARECNREGLRAPCVVEVPLARARLTACFTDGPPK
eukprot:scaffold7989_cov403-Prasinococcus_capsulatus_cf.AAC.6